MKTARDYAKDMLRPYVERGDLVNTICDSHMGHASQKYWAQIGYACINGEMRKLKPRQLAVTEIEGKACLEIFSVDELVAEIRSGQEQLSLWGNVS